MCCFRSSRAWYLFVVSFWLLLTVIRQILDSIGKLWIPIIFNSFQVLSCICGLIATVYWQKRLLVIFMLLNFTSILYNIALILWYNELFTISRDIPILSAGFPYSYSFFLRYTPSCKSYYNLTNFRWIQLSCMVPYYHIEGAQALLHIFMANLSIILSIVLLPKQNFNKKFEKQITNIIADGKFRTDHFTNDTVNNSNEYNQRYSKDGINLTNRRVSEQSVKPENGYIRHSAKKSTRKGYRETINAHQNFNNFQKPFILKRSQSMTDFTNGYQEMKYMHSEQNDKSINTGLTNTIHATNRSQIATTKTMTSSSCVNRSGSLKNFKMPTTEGVRRILSREEINLADNFRTNNARTNSSNNNLISLVSFDPKSNVLLRIHNHIDNADDDDDDDDDDNNNDDRDDDANQQHQQQQQRISKQIPIIRTMEQIQHQNLNHPAASNYLANCQPKNLSFDFIATGSNGFYDLTSFGRSCNQKSSNSLRQQPLWYPKRGDNIVYDRRTLCDLEKSSTIDHSKSSIISHMPVLNSNDFFV